MSALAAAVPVLAALVGAVFAASVLLQYWRRRKPHQLFWGAGLLLFTLATSMEAVSALSAVLVGPAAVAAGTFAYASPAAFQAGSACAPGAAVTLADGRAFTCGLPIGGAAVASSVRLMAP